MQPLTESNAEADKKLEKQRKKEEHRAAKERKAQEKALAKARKKECKQRKEQRPAADASEVQPVLGAPASERKCLRLGQVREMVRLQLELDGWDPGAVADEWIDDLFNRFDADNSGTIDDAEWDMLVVAMRKGVDELHKSIGVAEHRVEPRKRLDRRQVQEMVRLQLELDGWDVSGEHYVSDGWIDNLFNRFDADSSGTIDDDEWDLLVEAMRDGMDELQKRGGTEAQPLLGSRMTTYGTTGPNQAELEPQTELILEPDGMPGLATPNPNVVICPSCHISMTWGLNSGNSYVCNVCKNHKTGERWVCQTCSGDQCAPCNSGVNLPPKLVCRRRYHDFYIDRFEAESSEGCVQDFDECHFDSAASDSDAVEVRVFIHEAKELVPKDGSTSDPFVGARCFGKWKKTSVAPPGIEAVFDEELQFVGTQTDLTGAMLTLECWDKDLLTRDDLIGTFSFDLGEVRKREDKEYYKTWVGLFNPKEEGEQGKLCVSVTILEPGDELPARPGKETPENADTAEFQLRVKVHQAEGIPRTDGNLANPYVSFLWANQHAQTKVADNTISPEWNEEVTVKVLVEQSVDAPPRSDVVLVRLREKKRIGMKEVAQGFVFLSDIQNKQWEQPCWLNFYGAARKYDDPFLKKPVKSEVAGIMNEGKMAGLTYRGRVLLSATMAKSPSDVASLCAGNVPANSTPLSIPLTTWYSLKVAVVSGCDLPDRSALAVRVTWGLPKSGYTGTKYGQGRHQDGRDAAGVDAWTQAESSSGGMAQWDRLLTIRGEWPADLTQVPDIFVELIDTEEKKRMYCLRIAIDHPFIRSPKDMVPQRRFGAPTLDCDWFDMQADPEHGQHPDDCEPQLLLSLGVECGRAPADRTIKCPHVRDKLPMSPARDQPVSVEANELEHSWWPVDDLMHGKVDPDPTAEIAGMEAGPKLEKLQRGLALLARLRSLPLDELRAQAAAEGVGPARLQDATAFVDHLGQPLNSSIRGLHSTAEGAALVNLLTKRLPDAAECQAKIRCHVYQARSLDAGFNSDNSELYVEARMWDADGEAHAVRSKTVMTTSRSVRWFETLEMNDVVITGPNTQSIQVRMGPDMVIAVYQKLKGGKRRKGQRTSSDAKEGASMIGRMRVRLSVMEARFEDPAWYPLRVPGSDVCAGELLIGFQLISSEVSHVSPAPALQPRQKSFDLDVTIVGARQLQDTAAILLTGVRKSLVKWELNDYEGKTPLADGENPNYLMSGGKQCYTILVENIKLPVDALYAPSITFSVHTEDDEQSVPIGFADLNLADVIQAGRSPELVSGLAGSSLEPEPEPEPDPEPENVERALKREAKLLKQTSAVRGYSVLQENDNLPDDSSDEGNDTNDHGAKPILGRYKSQKTVVHSSAAAAALALGLSAEQVAKCCENETFRSDFRANTGYTFKAAEEPRGKPERDPEWRVGRRKALDELETVHKIDAFTSLVLRSPDEGAASPGCLKVRVTATQRLEESVLGPTTRTVPLGLPRTHEDTRASITKNGIQPREVIVRLYAIRAFALSAKDAGNTSDPYLQATIDDADGDPQGGVWPKGAVVDGKDMGGKKVEISPLQNTLNPHFGQIFQWQVQLPGPSLKIVVKDHDDVLEGGVDDIIGETTIDLENRFFSHDWQSLAHQGGYDMKFPIEQRDLIGESGVTQGVLECWVEIFPRENIQLFPVMDIAAPQKQKFELRVVVWDASEMKVMDAIGGTNDLYVTGTLSYRDGRNRLKNVSRTTDIHWRSKQGKGSFNYRLVYKDLELPMTMPGAEESEFPRFVVKAYDQDVIGGNDLIGTEQVREIKDLFKRAWRKFEVQQKRDQELDKMTVSQLRVEARRLYENMLHKTTRQLETARSAVIKNAERIESLCKQQAKQRKAKEKVDELPESKLRRFLMEDPTRQLENTAVKFPEPSSNWVQHKLKGDTGMARIYYQHIYSNELTQEAPMDGILRQVFVDPSQHRRAAQFLRAYEKAGRHDTERDKGVRMWNVEKQHGSGTRPASSKY